MDLIVVMKDGDISEIGGYDELLEHHGAFSEFIHTYLTENLEELAVEEDPEGKITSYIITFDYVLILNLSSFANMFEICHCTYKLGLKFSRNKNHLPE
jgi:hypothetical protein